MYLKISNTAYLESSTTDVSSLKSMIYVQLALLEQFPISQGLKPTRCSSKSNSSESFRANSNITRIETKYGGLKKNTAGHKLLEQIPISQGLKQHFLDLEILAVNAFRANSNITRIETRERENHFQEKYILLEQIP
ncbi:MAG: hypothetical protein RIS64_3734, partial [Bacteroidota bacterium]